MPIGGKFIKKRFPLVFPGTLGVDVYAGSDGVLLGTQTAQPIGKAVAQDYAAAETVLTDETTGANNATTNDMTLFPAVPVANDAYYFGMAAKFFGLDLTIGTKMVSAVYTAVWEYYNGSTWATLTATLDETSDGTQGPFSVNGTGVKKVRWVPPSAWAAKASLGTVTGSYYWVRARLSAFTSISTVPLGSRVYGRDLTHLTGIKWRETGVIRSLQWQAKTASGSTADSKFLLINLTRGTQQVVTITKATVAGEVTSLALGMAEGDQLAVVQIQEDGSTEFADMQWWLDYGA